jgi:micrococcal nuclease
VIDGDTFVILYDGEPTSVRIWGINAPERSDLEGGAATHALKSLVEGKNVRIEFPESRKRDNFGRLLCTVWVDGLDVGQELIKGGLAKPYRAK